MSIHPYSLTFTAEMLKHHWLKSCHVTGTINAQCFFHTPPVQEEKEYFAKSKNRISVQTQSNIEAGFQKAHTIVLDSGQPQQC